MHVSYVQHSMPIFECRIKSELFYYTILTCLFHPHAMAKLGVQNTNAPVYLIGSLNHWYLSISCQTEKILQLCRISFLALSSQGEFGSRLNRSALPFFVV